MISFSECHGNSLSSSNVGAPLTSAPAMLLQYLAAGSKKQQPRWLPPSWCSLQPWHMQMPVNKILCQYVNCGHFVEPYSTEQEDCCESLTWIQGTQKSDFVAFLSAPLQFAAKKENCGNGKACPTNIHQQLLKLYLYLLKGAHAASPIVSFRSPVGSDWRPVQCIGELHRV